MKKESRKDSLPFVIRRNNQVAWLKTIRLVDENKVFNSNISLQDALRKSSSTGLDLVCFNKPEQDKLALCKLIDFGKWKYNEEKAKKKTYKEGKKITKELRFSLEIDVGDVAHKIKQGNDFLDQGMEVIYTMRLKGRERKRIKDAQNKMNDIVKLSSDHGAEINRKIMGNNISIRLSKSSV